MNKQELIDAILANKEAGIESKAAAARAVDAVLDGIAAGVKKDGNVQLIGFGTFAVKERAARDGRNPLTGEKIKIKASKTVGFKAGAALKASVAAKKAAAKKGKK
ncbi:MULTISPECIES: HU family DNA-binding protein [unclassified Fibrobacter]|jgi:DNA-binding protein HU-beta|uniref:HU family DNA-binding protein n=1 Tax=unclassified Fibrobacter TaxID=2634177 RepID=UPI0015677D1D|nr:MULTISPECIES: HU family DNA-binding protein [unclassified Fibrobacter]